jgi:hypothetical protein
MGAQELLAKRHERSLFIGERVSPDSLRADAGATGSGGWSCRGCEDRYGDEHGSEGFHGGLLCLHLSSRRLP